MSFDYSKLKGKIREVCSTMQNLSKLLSISYTSLSNKLNNHVEFSQKEIIEIANVLKIPYREIPVYFFTLKVQ